MKKLISLTALGSAALALSACGSSDPASTEATADTVEMPADEALEPITEEAVADADATSLEEVEGPPAVSEETAVEAAENAASVAEQAEAAAAEAEAAASAAEDAVNAAGDALDAVESVID